MKNGPLDIKDCVNSICPWSGEPVSADALTLYKGEVVGFCNIGCRDKFEKATELFDPLVDKNLDTGVQE